MAVRNGVHKCKNPDCWRQGKERLVVDVPVELIPVFKSMARRLGIRYAEVVGMVLEDEIRKRMTLEDSMRKTLGQAFDEELDRVEGIIEPFLSTPLKSKGKKGFSN